MSQSHRSQYFESKVLTAPPQRLHLLLVEGAIRFGREAEVALRNGDVLAADAPLLRTLDIIGEMLAGVRQTKTTLNEQIANLYLYMFRLVGLAKVHDDPEQLAEALKLLEFERETWQLVCDKLGHDPAPATTAATAAAPPRSGITMPHIATASTPSAGISLQA